MSSGVKRIGEYPWARGISLNQIQVDLSKEIKVYNENIEKLKLKEGSSKWDDKKLEQFFIGQDSLQTLSEKTRHSKNAVSRALDLFNLLVGYQRLNTEVELILADL